MSRRATRPDGPLDLALERLRSHGLPYRGCYADLRVWEAAAPCCSSGGWDLLIREAVRGGPITLRSACGHSEEEIRAALEREPVEPRVEAALQLAEESREIAERALELAARSVAA